MSRLCQSIIFSAFPIDILCIGNVVAGRYKYMADLHALEATATGTGPECFAPATPLIISAWKQSLKDHPDKDFAGYILSGIQHGFHIGVVRSKALRSSRDGNLPSVRELPSLVVEHLAAELRAGRILGPLPPHLAKLCQVSPIGLIPKPHQPGRYRLIVDLSSPHGESVYDAIPVDPCHMHYSSVLDAAALVRHLGRGTVLAKIDLLHAYRIIPVHSDDHPLLGIKWEQDTFIDTALPFGLRSAPKIFSAFADALAWTMRQRGIIWQLHYLDDFLFLGSPKSADCASALRQAIDTCKLLGVPVAAHKTEGPSTCLTFLGIHIDTVAMCLSLAEDKLAWIKSMVLQWRSRRTATKRELQSLIGHLSHAAIVVLPGRTFLRRMIDLMKVAKLPHHHIRLTADFRSDLQWWASFLPGWNGRSIMPQPEPTHTVMSDASGSWGCGAVSDSGAFFQVQWTQSWAQVNIAVKEMLPVVIAVAIWGQSWEQSMLLVRSDNMSVVHALSAGTAKDSQLMHLLRCLHFFTASYQIGLFAKHIAGVANSAADALSRNNLSAFRLCTPQAAKEPSLVPPQLLDMLMWQRPDWTSTSWRTMFLSTLGRH